MQKITPCLWFDKNCEEAVTFYTTVFPNSKIRSMKRYPEGMSEGPMQGMEGKVLTAIIELDGHVFQALDGGPIFKISPAISFMLNFDPSKMTDAEAKLNDMWAKLSDGNSTVRMELQEYPFSKRYGWVEDRFGVNWQLILTDPAGEPRPFIIPSLLFTQDVSGKAEEAAQYYVSMFKNSKMGAVAKYPMDTEMQKAGDVMFEDFMLENQWFSAMDGGATAHNYTFNEAVSLSIETADQAETDYFWERLSAHPENEQCGWVKDKYGVSWQIVPKRLGELMSDPDQKKSNRVLSAMLAMKKLDIAALEAAYNS